MNADEVWEHIHRERTALATLLAGLTDEQWEHPSGCAGWRVREVAAHVISSATMTRREAALGLIRARGNFNAMIDVEARRSARRPTAEIVADYARVAGSRRHPPGTSILDPLVDVLVHTQDITGPLGLDHPVPPEAARLALPRARAASLLFGTRSWTRGHRLVATDTDYAAGSGPVVSATAGELLLMLTGRRDLP